MKYVIDAYAWVEYFNGSELGKKVRAIVENEKNKIYTNVVTIAELSSFFKRKDRDFSEVKKVLFSLSLFQDIDFEFSEEVGTIHAVLKKKRKHIGLADIFVLYTGEILNAKVVTGDEDFRGLKNVVMIK